CSPASCGAMVTLFSGLSLGPGTYFLTIGPDPISNGEVGWFPTAPDTTLVVDTGVSKGTSFIARAAAPYPPAGVFATTLDAAMNFTVSGAAASPIPEPATTTLIALGAFCLLIIRGIGQLPK